MTRAECERCGNEITNTDGQGADRDGWRHLDYPNGCPNDPEYQIEQFASYTVTINAPNAEAARAMADDYSPEGWDELEWLDDIEVVAVQSGELSR